MIDLPIAILIINKNRETHQSSNYYIAHRFSLKYESLMQAANKSFSHYSPSVIRQVRLFDVDVTFVSKVGIDIDRCQIGK